MQQQARPAQQQRPAYQQARPAAQQQPHNAMPPQQPRRQQALPAQQQQAHPVASAGGPWRNNARAPQGHPALENRRGYDHGRISNAHYESRFGREHSFHVSHGDYNHRRFRYGGYAFGFIDPWPMDWGYSDDVYVEYTDDGYYMYDRFHPGVRIAINIL
jgi:hypothetical protein